MSALGNLMAGVAHEINNPLGCVINNVSYLSESVEEMVKCLQVYRHTFPNPGTEIETILGEIDMDFILEDLPKMLDSMTLSCQRMGNISKSLRLFSRTDSQSKCLANLHEGIDSTLMILRYRLQGKKSRPEIQIIRHYGELPAVNCFPGQLNQVFMNILANGIDMFDEMAETVDYQELKANPQQISIETQQVDPNQVAIWIKDNGKGMSHEVCQQIFDRHFTTKPVGKGTGLGLAIVQQIVVENHGGHLSVHSEMGQGTQFLIQLPLKG